MREVKKSGCKLKEVQMGVNASINNVKNGFVGTGYYLGIIRSEKLWKEDGSASFDEYMSKNYQKDKSWASKCISVYDQFGERIEPGEKPRLRTEYQEYNVSQLFELIYLPEEKREEVTPKTPVKAIRELKPKKEKKVSTVETSKPDQEPQKWNPNPTPCIHREGYSCTVPEAQKHIPGDGSNCGRSCCWECVRRGECKWECNSSQLRPEEPEPVRSEQDPIIDADYEEISGPAVELKPIGELDLSCKTESILKRAGIDTIEGLSSMSDEELTAVRGMSKRAMEEIKTKLRDSKSMDTTEQPERIYTLEEVAKEIIRLEATYLGAPEEVKQSAPYKKNVMRLDAMRLLYVNMKGE